MAKRVCPVEALIRYVEVDMPYESRRSIYPHLHKIEALTKYVETDIKLNRKHIYHARERRHLIKHGQRTKSGYISCSTKSGCKEFASSLSDPVFFKIDTSMVDWYVYVPDVFNSLYRDRTIPRETSERVYNLFYRVDAEKEYIVPYTEGLLENQVRL